MSKKLFSRILRFCIRITVCGLGCMILAAAVAAIPILAALLPFLVLLIKTAADRRSFIRNAERTIAREEKPDYLQIPDALTMRTTKEFCKGYYPDFAVVAKRFLSVTLSILGFLFVINLLLSGPPLWSGI